jgi:hypothetical protein
MIVLDTVVIDTMTIVLVVVVMMQRVQRYDGQLRKNRAGARGGAGSIDDKLNDTVTIHGLSWSGSTNDHAGPIPPAALRYAPRRR